MTKFGACEFIIVKSKKEIMYSVAIPIDDWLWAYDEGYVIIKVSDLEGNLIGLIALDVQRDKSFTLELLEVFPEYRRKGYGKNIIAYCVNFQYEMTKEKNSNSHHSLKIHCKASTLARDFYKGIGAVESINECDLFLIDSKTGKELIKGRN